MVNQEKKVDQDLEGYLATEAMLVQEAHLDSAVFPV